MARGDLGAELPIEEVPLLQVFFLWPNVFSIINMMFVSFHLFPPDFEYCNATESSKNDKTSFILKIYS